MSGTASVLARGSGLPGNPAPACLLHPGRTPHQGGSPDGICTQFSDVAWL